MDFLFIDGGALCWLDIFLVSYKEKEVFVYASHY